MKKHLTNIEKYKSVKMETKNKFSKLISEKLIVPEFLQKKELENLSNGLRYEQFYFVVDAKEMKIIYADGLEEIGFNSQTFDMTQYVNSLPSRGILQVLTLLWFKIFEFCEKEKNVLKFLSPKYIVQIPMKNANSEIMLVKRTISPFQYSENGKIIQYLSEFNIIKFSFDNEPPSPRFIHLPESILAKKTAFLNTIPPFDFLPFSPKEKQILEIYSNDVTKKSTKELAEIAKVTPATLQFYNKMILANTREFLGEIYKFESAKQVAHFFKNCVIK